MYTEFCANPFTVVVTSECLKTDNIGIRTSLKSDIYFRFFSESTDVERTTNRSQTQNFVQSPRKVQFALL